MRRRLKQFVRPFWAKHVAFVLQEYGHETLKAEHAALQQKALEMSAECDELRAQLNALKGKPLRKFTQLTCEQPQCEAPRFRSGLCYEHHIEVRRTQPI